MKKGIYLYKYMDSFERFREAELLAKEAFWTKLHDKNISEEEYEHAQKAWEAFGHDLYVTGCCSEKDRCGAWALDGSRHAPFH